MLRFLAMSMLALVLAACTATDGFDRAIGEDISGARDRGPTAERPGMPVGHAPIGSVPWLGGSAATPSSH